MKSFILTTLCVLVIAAAKPKPPASRPVKPLTYAELKTENETLKATIVRLRAEIAELRPKPNGKEVREGMTLAEAEAAAGNRATLKSESNGTQLYVLYHAGESSRPTGPNDRNASFVIYEIDVRNDKVVGWTKRFQPVLGPRPGGGGGSGRFLK